MYLLIVYYMYIRHNITEKLSLTQGNLIHYLQATQIKMDYLFRGQVGCPYTIDLGTYKYLYTSYTRI